MTTKPISRNVPLTTPSGMISSHRMWRRKKNFNGLFQRMAWGHFSNNATSFNLRPTSQRKAILSFDHCHCVQAQAKRPHRAMVASHRAATFGLLQKIDPAGCKVAKSILRVLELLICSIPRHSATRYPCCRHQRMTESQRWVHSLTRRLRLFRY